MNALSLKSAATVSRVSATVILNAIRRGYLPARKHPFRNSRMWTIRRQDLIAWAKDYQRNGQRHRKGKNNDS